MKRIVKFANHLLARGMLPDFLIRYGIRGLLQDKLREEIHIERLYGSRKKEELIDFLKQSPIAINTKEANEQHYELPSEFFKLVMGKFMKYSSGYWKDGVKDFDQSELDMLEITVERAGLENGQDILELGCGWGSLTLFMAQKYPLSRIIAVSNSRIQKVFIEEQAFKRSLTNVEVITADMNVFNIDQKFDRVVSVEMFEHMRNYEKLMEKIAGFLKDGGKLFVHIFSHKDFAYLYDASEDSDWIAKYFFTGGIMPSDDLLLNFNSHFNLEEHWQVSGTHYAKTSRAWLDNMDKNKSAIFPILKSVYGQEQYRKWWVYWRVFFMSCEELWGFEKGNQWIVSHYRFKKK